MSEEGNGFPKVQVGTFIKGDQWVFRADSGDDLKELVVSVNENAEEVVTALSGIKQVAVAKGIFTGDSNAGGKTPAKSTGSRATGSRAKDNAPPTEDVTFFEGDDGESYASIECQHGPMKDLRGKGYKADLYCTLNTDDYKKKCKPVKL